MILRPLNGRQRQVAPAPQRPANPNRMNQGDQVIQNQPVDNPQAQRANRRNQGPPVNQNQPGGNPPVQANRERIMAEPRPLSFKDIKIASEAMQAMIPRFSGENPDELYSSWLQRFTREANALTLGHQLTALVFPRLLTGKAQLKYQTLTEQQQAEFGVAAQALGEKLRSVGSRTKAMNSLAKIEKKHSESLIAFAKRIECQVRVGYPNINLAQREEIGINRFIEGLPERIRRKMKELDGLETINEAVERAERFEEILADEDTETINLIKKVNDSERQNNMDDLLDEIQRLQLETQRQKKQISMMGNQGYSANRGGYNQRGTYPSRGSYRPRGQQYSGNSTDESYQGGQRNDDRPQYQRGRGNFAPRGGWQMNRSPRGTGLNFLMIMSIIVTLLQLTSATELQICPNARSGEYFAPPSTTKCILEENEIVIKTNVSIYTEYGGSKKITAYRCSKTTYNACYRGLYNYLMRDSEITNLDTNPMTKQECESALKQHQVNDILLQPKGENIFQSTPEKIELQWDSTEECKQECIYTLEVGELATPDGEATITNLGDTSGCKAQKGECKTTNSIIIWEANEIKKFCKFSVIADTEAFITRTKVAIPELQMALQIEPNQNSKSAENCVPNLTLLTNNGFMISLKNYNNTTTLDSLIGAVANRTKRVKRNLLKQRPKDLLVKRLFGPNATSQNFPAFSYDPVLDHRLVHEIRRLDVSYAHIRFQWENYELPNKQIAVLRAIREGEMRKQLIRELRENEGGLKNAVFIKQLEEPSHYFDQYLTEEFGPARILSGSDKREWQPTIKSLQNTIPIAERTKAGLQYVQKISEQSVTANENKGNAQLNSRLQYVTDKIIETNYNEFNKVYHKICELQNMQIEISKTLLAIDPTLGMRAILKREDIVAKRAGTVYLVSQCQKVIPQKIHYDHKINGKCYMDVPVSVQNQTWFIAPGTEIDLIKESPEISCEEVTLAIYKDKNGNWKSQNGMANVRKIPINHIKPMKKLNLTLSAPSTFNNLKNVENPIAYLATWTNMVLKMRDSQIEIMKDMKTKGLASKNIEEILEKGADGMANIANEIQQSLEQGTKFIKETLMNFIKSVVVPIVTVIFLVLAAYFALKIYFVRKAGRKTIVELAQMARKAPPMVQHLMRKMKPEINNINLNDDDDEGTELEQFYTERRRSIVTIPEVLSIVTAEGKNHLPFVPIQLNGVPITALIDSGASISLVPEKVIKRLGIEKIVEKTTCSAKVANGTKLKFLGKTKINITVGKTKTTHEFLVVKNTETPARCLMGIDFINRLNVLGQSVTFNLPENHVKVGNDKVDLWKPEEEGCAENGTITVVCAEDGSHKQHQDSETSEISEDSDASEKSEENESENLEGQDQTKEFEIKYKGAEDVDESNRELNDKTSSWPDEENSRCDAAKGLNPM